MDQIKNLRRQLFENDMTQAELSKKIGHSEGYISDRMGRKKPFSADDIYDICDLLQIPYEKFHEHFPRSTVVKKKRPQTADDPLKPIKRKRPGRPPKRVT